VAPHLDQQRAMAARDRSRPVTDDEADGRRRRGNRTRESILQAAADLVRQVVIDDAREFLAFLTRELRKAQEAGDLDPSVEPEQIAFELDALGAAHQQFQLMHDPAVFDRAERAVTTRLDALATKADPQAPASTGRCSSSRGR
jgi:hypothetical protein